VLRGAAGLAVAGAASGVASGAQNPGFGGWFSNVSNYDGIVDETGADEVTVQVGTKANGANYGYGPAAVRVSPGTTVTWEWTGKGFQHNVFAENGRFESDLYQEEGATFEHTFDSAGVYKYYCSPHESVGMKGAVLVGDAQPSGGGGNASAAGGPESAGGDSGDGAISTGLAMLGGALLAAFLSPIAFAALLFGVGDGSESDRAGAQHDME
jgi:halocyanin-like protein